MFQYRQVLLRLRQGDSDRDIARSGLMGRPKVAVFRLLADAQGWLKRNRCLAGVLISGEDRAGLSVGDYRRSVASTNAA
jgi:hypothetical protein